MSESIQVVIEPTPNPNSLKFSWAATVVDGGPFDFANPKVAESSPLATKLFRQNGVMGVFIARDFVTVTKHPGVGWELLQVLVKDVIRNHVESGELIVEPDAKPAELAADPADVEARIRKVLDEQIRPAVAMDGGDIHFVGFNAGVVLLQLKGACSGCPSSMATLKMGVENRLRQEVPEVVEVAQIM
ncbi:MAG: NifU family protein [Planctomycetes bacterium]|nr:NifU family protein [Planctomycetota bacterium]